MSRSALAPFDWPGWRTDVVDRLDRRSIGAGSAFAAVWATLSIIHLKNDVVVRVAEIALFSFSTVMVTLAVLAMALVAVRSEERRVGKECVTQCRSRWSPYH